MNDNYFPITSRYYLVDTATLEVDENRTIRYIRRRFCPSPERFTVLREHSVCGGDRLDTVTDKYLGDPLRFWQVCDANAAMRPEELTETVGRQIHITLPEGISTATNA